MARPNGSFIPPDQFVPLAEEVGLAESLTEFVIRKVAEDMLPILRRDEDFHVAINFPPSVVGSGVGKRAALESGLYAFIGQVIAEITERQALTAEGMALLNESRKTGLKIALDDFGTGYSGLTQLIDLDVDYIKIDRRFVLAVNTRRGRKLIEATVALARVINARLIAEGVETENQASYLRNLGVEFGQGWHWSRDLPAATLNRYLKSCGR